jgi:hypothetical protein
MCNRPKFCVFVLFVKNMFKFSARDWRICLPFHCPFAFLFI